jgi:hypothetical protein
LDAGGVTARSRPKGEAAAEKIATEMAVYRTFYQKYLEVKGLPIAAHRDVADLALQRTYDIVSHMLAGAPTFSSRWQAITST